jgi:hypothetical protein
MKEHFWSQFGDGRAVRDGLASWREAPNHCLACVKQDTTGFTPTNKDEAAFCVSLFEGPAVAIASSSALYEVTRGAGLPGRALFSFEGETFDLELFGQMLDQLPPAPFRAEILLTSAPARVPGIEGKQPSRSLVVRTAAWAACIMPVTKEEPDFDLLEALLEVTLFDVACARSLGGRGA